MGQGPSVVTAMALVTAIAQVQSLAQEVPHGAGTEKKKKKIKNKEMRGWDGDGRGVRHGIHLGPQIYQKKSTHTKIHTEHLLNTSRRP